ncbi:MAG: NAD-dependent epimerase/dehydratase family protein, partial [Bacteroidota bacterium]
MVLVTGGTGLVGAHLLTALTKIEPEVKAIYRRSHKIEATKSVFDYLHNGDLSLFNKIEWLKADLNNIPQLTKAFKGVTKVYHCAAFVSFEPDKYKLLRKINIEGTANIINLCIKNKIEKLCYVSSIAAIGKESRPEKLITESTAWNPEDDNSVYAITKYGAEMEVWRGSQEGIDVVVVNPGVIIGGGFWKSGSSGSLLHRLSRGMKYYTNGVTGYVGVTDVIETMISLMESTIKNQGFILVAENLSFKDFQDQCCEALGVPKPSKEANPWLLEIAWRIDWLNHKIFGKRRSFSKQLAKSSSTITLYDSSKIKEVLDFEFEPLGDVIEETAKW